MENNKKRELRGGIQHSKGMIIMQFSLNGCNKCGMLNAALRQYQESDPGQFELHEIIAMDGSKEHPMAKEYKISSVPTVLIWKDGILMDTLVYPFIEDIKRAVKLWGDKYDQRKVAKMPQKENSK